MALNSGDDDHDLDLVSTKQTRVWSEEDEIAILRGLAAYRDDTHCGGVVPSSSSSLSHMDDFLPFIRPSLEIKEDEAEVNNTQLIDKIRRLRNKYSAVRLRCRDDRRHLNPHDETLYHLSSKVWGDNEAAGVEENGDDATTPHSSPRRRHSSRIVTTNPPPPPPAKEKQHQQRVWIDEDEIAILCGLADYCAETGTIPSGLSHMDSFLPFIRKSLRIKEEVKKTQLNDKVRHLREKYQALRRRGRGGRKLSFNNTHDELLYRLSRRVWGAAAEDGNASNDASANGNVANKKLRKGAEENGDAPPDNNANAAAEKKKNQRKRRRRTKTKEAEVEENGDACAGETTTTKKKNTKEEEEEEEGAPSNQDSARVIKRKVSYPFLMDAITRAGMMTNSDAVKRGLELADPSKAQVLEERWKRLRLLETKNYLRRASLIKETVKLSLDSLENEG